VTSWNFGVRMALGTRERAAVFGVLALLVLERTTAFLTYAPAQPFKHR
jgi:hypothetical protein